MTSLLSRALALALVASACAHAPLRSGTIPAEAFPKRAELEALEVSPVLAAPAHESFAPISHWKAVGPLPVVLSEAPIAPADDRERQVMGLVGERAGQTRQSLACAARELGAIVLEHGNVPARPLREFILARCGSTVMSTHVRWQSGTFSGQVTDAELSRRMEASMRSALAEIPADSRFGFWLGRSDTRALFVLVHGRAEVDLEPIELTPVDGKLIVRGRLRAPSERVTAAVTRGAFSAAPCSRLPAGAEVDVAFSCPLDAADALARVEVVRFAPGRLLGEGLLHLVALPSGQPADAWDAPAPMVSTGETGQERIVEAINALRARAGLSPVSDDSAESASAVRLLPHYLQANAPGGDPRNADRIALGLMAGWYVAEPKVEGRFASLSSGDGAEAGLIEALAAQPSGRMLLLEPEVAKVACAVQSFEGGAFALVSTYRLHRPFGDAQEAAKVFLDRLEALRKERGLSRPRRTRLPRAEESALTAALANGTHPSQSLNDAMSETVAYTSRAVRGWVLQGPSFDEIRIPDRLLDEPKLDVMVVAGASQADGHPWVQATILLVSIETGKRGERSAMRGNHSKPPRDEKSPEVSRTSGLSLSGKRDLNPRPPPWQGDALPLSYSR
jgi:hypothetical protein